MAQSINLDSLIEMGEKKGFEVKHDVDYGAGPINIVWNINVHPALPDIKCGFVVLEAEEGGNQDTEDNQLSLRKIEEAAFRRIRKERPLKKGLRESRIDRQSRPRKQKPKRT